MAGVASKPKPARKRAELLEGVIQHLAQHGLSDATFRSLAKALGISTYPLVYYFGTKEELLGAVVAEVERRQRQPAEVVSFAGDAAADAGAYWKWSLENRDLLRLDYEIIMRDAQTPGRFGPLRRVAFDHWHTLWTKRFVSAGMPRADARVEATRVVAAIVGLQFDLIATGDEKRTTKAFEGLIKEIDEKMRALRTATVDES
jgi:AcrR family transcriptional regulator